MLTLTISDITLLSTQIGSAASGASAVSNFRVQKIAAGRRGRPGRYWRALLRVSVLAGQRAAVQVMRWLGGTVRWLDDAGRWSGSARRGRSAGFARSAQAVAGDLGPPFFWLRLFAQTIGATTRPAAGANASAGANARAGVGVGVGASLRPLRPTPPSRGQWAAGVAVAGWWR